MTPDELRENVEDAIAMGISADVSTAGIAAAVVRLIAPAVLEMAAKQSDRRVEHLAGRPESEGPEAYHRWLEAAKNSADIRALAATWAKAEGEKS